MTRNPDQATLGERLEAALASRARTLFPDVDRDLLDRALDWLLRRREFERARRINASIWPRGKAASLWFRRSAALLARSRRKLVQSGFSRARIDRLEALYPAADAVLREREAERDLVSRNGCWKCRHYRGCWERARGGSPWPRPSCALHREVLPFCPDFDPSSGCSQCGTPIVPPVKDPSSFDWPVLCTDCYATCGLRVSVGVPSTATDSSKGLAP